MRGTVRTPRHLQRMLRQKYKPWTMGLADDFNSAPGWRKVGSDWYTCVPQVHVRVDPATLKRIHEFDPGLIPMYRKQRYLPTGAQEPVTVTHFALGRYVKEPRASHALFHVEMPEGANHPRPNMLEAVLEERDLLMMHHGGPGGFQAFGPWLYHVLRKAFMSGKQTGKQWFREVDRMDHELTQKEQRKADEEKAYRNKGMDRVHKRADELTKADWDAWWDLNQKLRTPKPFIHVGGKN